MKKFLIIFFLNIFFIKSSFALIEVDITRGNLDPLPIAISPLHVDIKSEKYEDLKIKELGNSISKIIENNLQAPGILQIIKSPDIYLPLIIFAFLVIVTIFLRKKFYKK